MTTDNYQIIDNGDAAISVIFDEPICEELTYKIIQLSEQLGTAFDEKFDDVILGYQSLTLCYNPITIPEEDLKQTISSLLNQSLPALVYTPKLIVIPVCYELEFAPDLEAISKHSGLSTDEVIEFHSKEQYLVHMLGFLPGFLYLDGLNTQLACPRKTTPKTDIKAGSIGIAEGHTCIYPFNSPGGWNIIGRTPLQLFKPESEQPFLAKPLDKIKFIAISKSEFLDYSATHKEVEA